MNVCTILGDGTISAAEMDGTPGTMVLLTRMARAVYRHANEAQMGMRLKECAGWNQTEADWRRVLDLDPDGCLVAEVDGEPAGTTIVTVFGPVAWVAMVLVDPAHRRQGIGRALMREALAFTDGLGVRTVRLQATPMGRPLYEELGFISEYQLLRCVGVLPHGSS